MSIILFYLPSIMAITGVQLIGLISPGPDFAIVMRNSLVYSRRTGLMTALGIACGLMIHVTYIIYGLGSVVTQTLWLFTIFKFLGAGYLIYIGYKGVRAQKTTRHLDGKEKVGDITSFYAFRTGFLTNVLNPKAMLFILSLFTLVIEPQTPPLLLKLYAAIFFITTVSWFSVVALFFSTPHMRDFFSRIKHWIERITGGFLILLGVRLAFTDLAENVL